MNTSLDLNRLIFDPAGADGYGGFDSNTIGSYTIDGYGNAITSTTVSGTNLSLDVFAALADGYGNKISSTNGSLDVNLTTAGGGPLDTNYGTVGANTLRTAAQIGNATGAADFNVGGPTAQTLRTIADLADGYGNQVSSTGGSLNVNITNSAANEGLYFDNTMWVSGNLGRETLAVRHDAETTIAAADGYYAPLQLDAYGRLKVDAQVTLVPQSEFYEEGAHLFTDPLMHVGTVVKTDAAALPNSNNTYSSFFVDGYGQLKVVANFDPTLISNGELKVVLDSVADDAPDAYNPIKVGSRSAPGPLTPLSNSNDRADLISDLYRRIYINDSSNIGLQSNDAGAISANTATQIAVTALGGRRRMIVQNRAKFSVFLGQTGVTVNSGLEIRGGQSMNLDIGPDVPVFIIAAQNIVSGDVRVFELA